MPRGDSTDKRLEDPDEYITLKRAARLSGLSTETLRVQANAGKLTTVKLGRDHLTNRRWLHQYLQAADAAQGGQRKPLPADYVIPDPAGASPGAEATQQPTEQ